VGNRYNVTADPLSRYCMFPRPFERLTEVKCILEEDVKDLCCNVEPNA